MNREEILSEISELTSMQEEAIRSHPLKTSDVYNAFKSIVLIHDPKDWDDSINFKKDEIYLINNYIKVSSFISAWYHLSGYKKKRDQAAHSCVTLISNLGMDSEAVFKKHFDTEQKWRKFLKDEGVIKSKAWVKFLIVSVVVSGVVYWLIK